MSLSLYLIHSAVWTVSGLLAGGAGQMLIMERRGRHRG